METQFIISRDANGNKTVKIKQNGKRGFSVQTLGNMPKTHTEGVCDSTFCEAFEHVMRYGTRHQQLLFTEANQA